MLQLSLVTCLYSHREHDLVTVRTTSAKGKALEEQVFGLHGVMEVEIALSSNLFQQVHLFH